MGLKIHQKNSFIDNYKMKLYIKNMVGNSCKTLVKSEIKKLGLNLVLVELGEVEIAEIIVHEQRNQLNANLQKIGLELLDNKRSMIIESIKTRIIELVRYSDKRLRVRLSFYLSEKLEYDYTYLANIFSENQGITIEQFFLNQKIERVKELLLYNDSSLTEIADKMQYSSVGHLSNQFRKITGMTPTNYKLFRLKKCKPLEEM
jgi:YesN/AraC family two-component response regulator